MLPEIQALGATLVAISPQLPEHNRELIERRHLTFEILSDRGNEVAASFGLRFSLPGPQAEQPEGRRWPHSRQNFAPDGFSCRHWGQRTGGRTCPHVSGWLGRGSSS